MRGSHQKRTPSELTNWLALESASWKPTYSNLRGEIKGSVVNALREAQRDLCVYCGCRLHLDSPEMFHIEHFRPKSKYPHLSVDFTNLFLSCGPKGQTGKSLKTCGNAKEDKFDEINCIEPEYPACTHRFRFLLTGKVSPKFDKDAAAGKMIELLNLNDSELIRDREEILGHIDDGTLDLSDFIDPTNGEAQGYAHVVCEHLGTNIP